MKIKTALLTLTAVYAAISGTIYYEAMNRKGKLLPMVYSHMNRNITENEDASDDRILWMESQEFEPHFLINARGQKLQGWYLKAKEQSKKFVIFSHGYRSTGRREFRYMARFYHEAGFHLFFVDHVGSGDSEGDFISFGYHESADLIQWIEYLINTFGQETEIVLQGMSMGSATVMMVAGSPDLPKNVRFAVSDCGYTDLTTELSFALKSAKLPTHPIVDTANLIQKSFFGFPLSAVSPIAFVRQAQIPMLFIHGDQDQLVPFFMLQELYDACPTEKDLLVVPGARHTMCYRDDPEGYEEKVSAFCKRFL